MSRDDTDPRKMLILKIEVPGVWCDDLEESARVWAGSDEPTDQDRCDVVTEEWMRPEVGLTAVMHTGEADEVTAWVGRIVGAEVRDLRPGVRGD